MRVVIDPAPQPNPAHGFVGPADPAFDIEFAGLCRLFVGGGHRGTVLLDHMAKQCRLVPGRLRFRVAENTVVPAGAARNVVDEVQIPGAHPGRIERERQGLACGLDLAGPLLDSAFQGFVGEPQALLRAFTVEQQATRLILPGPRPQGRPHRMGQRLRIDRPLEQNDVAEPLDHGGRVVRAPPEALGRQDDEREVGPGRLLLQPCVQAGVVRIRREFLLGYDDRTSRFEARNESGGFRHDGGRCSGSPENLLDDAGVATAWGQDEHAAFVHRRRHSAAPSWDTPSIAIEPW